MILLILNKFDVDHPNGPCFAARFDVEYYLNPKIPDLHNAFNSLPFAERELRAIEHYNV